MSSVNLGMLNTYAYGKLLSLIFSYLSPAENAKNITICKIWKERASPFIKDALMDNFKNSTVQKAHGFLELSTHQFEELCPRFKKIKLLKDKLNFKQIKDQLKKLKKTYQVYFDKFVVIHPFGSNFPLDKVNDICNRAFTKLHFAASQKEDSNQTLSYNGKVPFFYFPIDLFNLTLNTDQTVTGEKDREDFCIFLKGKIIQFTLTPEIKKTNLLPNVYTGLEKASTVWLAHRHGEAKYEWYIWAENLFIPRLHSLPLKNNGFT